MPKPIKIMVTVEEAAFGVFFNRFESMPGVVSFEIIGTDHVKRQSDGPSADRPKMADVITAFVRKHKSCAGPDIMQAVVSQGFKKQGAYGAISSLVAARVLKRTGERGEFKYTIGPKAE